MKIIYNKLIPFGGNKLFTFLNIIFAKFNAQLTTFDINHEAIHQEQEKETLITALIAKGGLVLKNPSGKAVALFDYETSSTGVGGCYLWIKNPADGAWYRLNFANLTTVGTTTEIIAAIWDKIIAMYKCTDAGLISGYNNFSTTETIYKYTSSTTNGVIDDPTYNGKYFTEKGTVASGYLVNETFIHGTTPINSQTNALNICIGHTNGTDTHFSLNNASSSLSTVSTTSEYTVNNIYLDVYTNGNYKEYVLWGYYYNNSQNRLFLQVGTSILELKLESYTVKVQNNTTAYTIPSFNGTTIGQVLTWINNLPYQVKNLI